MAWNGDCQIRATLERALRKCISPQAWGAVALGTVILSATELVYAQDAPAPGASNAPIQEVVVTGSRLKLPEGMTTPTPVTALTSDALADIAPGNVAQALDQLPQFYNDSKPQTAGAISGALGASNVNLRGLGTNRTLVLLDGKRVVPFNRLGAVDISVFPQALIKRVDVVTGGASAAYGTDAVAGVVNFVLDTQFTGLDVRVQGGDDDLQDYGNAEASVAFGTKIGSRMHFVGSLDYNQNAEIKSYSNRDWFQGWSRVTAPGGGTAVELAPHVVSTTFTCGGLISAPGTPLDRQEFLSNGTTQPFQVSGLSSVTGSRTQSIAAQYGGGSGCDPSLLANRDGGGSVVPEQERGSAFMHLDYDVSDDVQVFGQFLYGHNRLALNGNSATMSGTYQATIYSGNPYLPASVQSVMTNNHIASFFLERWNGDIDQGRIYQSNDTGAATAGFNADIKSGFLNGWHTTGYFEYGMNANRQTIHNFLRVDRLYQALDAVRDPVTGNIVCNAALKDPAQYGNCVPLNLFGVGNASQNAMNYVVGPDRTTDANVIERDAELSASGPLLKGWAGPITGALGVSWRSDGLNQTMDPASVTQLSVPPNNTALGIRGTPAYFTSRPNQVYQFAGAFPLSGATNVHEVFAETLVPLLADKPLVESLNLDLAGRYAWYSGSGGIPSYKAGLDWKVFSDLRLRGTYSRDVRAPNLEERFDTQFVGGSVRDPLLGNITEAIGTISGGNPSVKPEKANTETFGFVYQPSYLSGLSASVDYYSVDISDAIGQLATQDIVNGCIAGSATYCSYIQRDPATNMITQIFDAYLNINKEKVSGVDLEVDYQKPLSLLGGANESLTARMFYTYLGERSFIDPGVPKNEYAGDITQGFPKNRVVASLAYNDGPYRLFIQGRYIGSGVIDHTLRQGIDIVDNHVPSITYTDLRLVYTLPTDNLFEFYFNVNNLFNRTPPLDPGSCCGLAGTVQTSNGLYDIIGRQYMVGFHAKL